MFMEMQANTMTGSTDLKKTRQSAISPLHGNAFGGRNNCFAFCLLEVTCPLVPSIYNMPFIIAYICSIYSMEYAVIGNQNILSC